MKQNDTNLICYHFGNMYLSSIQQGIQAAHCQTEMALKYLNFEQSKFSSTVLGTADYYKDWAKNYKTMICLNGGDNASLKELLQIMEMNTNTYPWASFIESDDALKGLLTNICIVLPERIQKLIKSRSHEFAIVDIEQNYEYYNSATGDLQFVTEFEHSIIQYAKECSLAK